MKGVTEIALTDVQTGEVKIQEDNNQFTQVLSQIYEQNFGGLMFGVDYNLGRVEDRPLFPIVLKSLGGILLFQQAQGNERTQIFAPSTNPCVGYASNTVNGTSDLRRGSYNETESGPVTNGYRHVWDFTTAQANGTISSVSLTHVLGGVAYMGGEHSAATLLRQLNKIDSVTTLPAYQIYTHMVEADVSKNIITTITPENGSLVIRTYWEPFSKVSILDTLGGDYRTPLSERRIQPVQFLSFQNNYSYCFLDGRNGYWYGIARKRVGHKNQYKWIKINKTEYTFSERDLELEAHNLQIIGQIYRESGQQTLVTSANVVLRGQYMYFMTSDGDKLVKMHVDNDVDISVIELERRLAISNKGFILIGDWIVFSGGMVDQNDKVYYGKTFADDLPLGVVITHGPLLMVYRATLQRSVVGIERSLYLVTPYLATVNNLAKPVVKTANHTMKITYTITETEE